MFRSIVLSVFVLVLSVVAPARAAEPLKIAYSDWPGWLPFEIAIQKGFFKEAGVDVAFTWFEYGPSMEAYGAGQIDAVPLAMGDALITASSRGSAVVLITDYSNGNDMIVARPGVESLKDLKGKKIGIELNLVEHLLLSKGLEKAGLTEADVTLVNVPTNDTPQVLASGDVDAIGAWHPVSHQAIKAVPGAKPVFTSADVPGLIYDVLLVDRASLEARRDDWAKVVAVWYRTINWMNDPANKDEALKLMAARVNIGADELAPLMKGTSIMTIEESLKAFRPGDGLDSLYGSAKVCDAFNVKGGAYKDQQDVNALIDPSLVTEFAAKK